MKKYIVFLILIIIFGCTEQKSVGDKLQIDNSTSYKIKVYLLGTFHFAQTDSTYNVKDAKHQESIRTLNDIIVGLKPDKIFIERMPEFEYQNKIDSLYTTFVNRKKEVTSPNEIWQVAFKVAKRLKHKKLYQCDNPGRYNSIYNQIEAYAKKNNQMSILEYKANGTTIPITSKINRDSLRQSMTLLEYLKWYNSAEVQESSHATYINVFPQLGYTDVYNYKKDYLLGASLTTDWYRRNIKIYTKMINQIEYTEDAIFLLMGNDHIPIIRHLFESNPYFEVVPTNNWLK